ncbi:acyl-CoA-binding domain-containing protein 3-like [Pistacia vera]|uniref:acyl-CoA-binding domain-containing protein 3-like n=1 Tax=Pistacia vera TaxID=55513 RepID=UPI00126377B4|nr:acyl-CoA-binding domain-containing protein 3-like [Pistacia vera]
MELLQELVLTAFIALLFSYLVAKLVSFSMSGGCAHDSNSATTEVKDVDERVMMEELQYGENLNVGVLESENRVQLVEETVEKVEKFQEGVQHVEEIAESASRDKEIETERCWLQEKLMEVGGLCKESPEEKIVEKEAKTEDDVVENTFENEESAVNNNAIIEESAVNNYVPIEETAINDNVIIEESAVNDNLIIEKSAVHDNLIIEKSAVHDNFIMEESGVNNNVIIEKSGEIGESMDGLVSEEDDGWEGIERSELEKVFGEATKFLGSGEKDDLVSDVQMELYGLHKIATEGPCHETQPMALMVSARAKWNAWQRLGNMNPEEAMEEYVKLLSDRVPRWMEEHCCGDNKLESHEAGKPDAAVPELGSFSGHQTNCTDERNLKLNCDSEAGDLTGGSCLETKAKE